MTATAWIRRALREVRDLWSCLQRARVFGLAAETAFWVFLSLVPLAAVGGLIAARFTTANWNQLSPVIAALPGPTRELVTSELLRVSRWNGGAVGATSALVFVWLASSGVHAMLEALGFSADVRRPWWKTRLIALGTCVFLSLAVAVLALLRPGATAALSDLAARVPALDRFQGPRTTLGDGLRFVAGLVVGLGYVAGLFRAAIPRTTRRHSRILPGAIVAVLLQVALASGYSTYVSRLGTGSAYSAGLAIVGLTMTAIYLSIVALLTGAYFNRRLETVEARGVSASAANA